MMGRGSVGNGTSSEATMVDGGGGAHDMMRGIHPPSLHGPRFDRLTVFQAAPLVWKDKEDNLHTIEMLEFEREREILAESMKEARTVGAEIELVFEPATTDRLGAFLAASETQVLHFTAHGLPEFLAIEDGLGGAQFLRDDDLREFMRAGNGELLFVFVSACYSRAAGEAFLEAGVPHVVCCQHDEPLMDLAAQEFSRSFYLSLACGKNLRQSFDLARQSVRLCPQIPDAANEMRKFLLLPENGDHDVPIFFTRPRNSSFGRKPSLLPSERWILPPPPEVFVGREMEMYKIIQHLGRSRLVRITGCPGSGKASVAAAVARYISVRERAGSLFDEVIWLPLIYTTRIDKLSSCFYELFAILQDESLAVSLQLNADYRRVVGPIFEALYQTKALLVIETKSFLEIQSINKLSIFLQDLLWSTKHVRVVLVCQQGFDISLRKVVESEVVVDPLDFEASATLFGRLCPFVADHRHSRACTPRQLSNILVPKEKADLKLSSPQNSLSKRCVDIFRMIGGGVPARIHESARDMTPGEYDRLIATGEQIEYNADCKTRVELEIQLERLREDVQIAIREKNFKKAKEIQSALDELEMQKEALPEIEELRRMAADLEKDLESAVLQKNFGEAENLSHQLDLLNSNIEVEQEALVQYDQDRKPSGKSLGNKERERVDLFSTRAGLECEIRKLHTELDKSVQERDFATCRRIQGMIDELISRRKSLPSHEELASKIASLKDELDNAVAARDFIEAESLHSQIQGLEERIASEKESEDNFVASTAVMLGRQLAELGDALQRAVDNQEHSRAKELETRILEEVRGFEEQFTLRYSELDVTINGNGVDSSGAGPTNDTEQFGAGASSGSTGEISPTRIKSKSSPPTFSTRIRPVPLLPKPDMDRKRASTIAHIPPSPTPLLREGDGRPSRVEEPRNHSAPSLPPDTTTYGEKRPGAVAVPGISDRHEERRPPPVAASYPSTSFSEEFGAAATSETARAQSYSQLNGRGDKTSNPRQIPDRFEQGLCPTCPEELNAVQCFIFKSSTADPRVRTRIPLTVDGLVYEGKCLLCDPEAKRQAERGSNVEREQTARSEQRSRHSSELMTLPPEPAGLPSLRNSVSADSNIRCSSATSENVGIMTPDIAVATRVDAVAQEEAIERIVRDAIRRVAEGTDERDDSVAGAAVGAVVSHEHYNGNNRRSEENDNVNLSAAGTEQKPKKKSFMKAIKFGKKKK